ncbi:hypothetical protein HH212_11005 [Massilia forsythiae]|uniref:Uncharacterized protein n=1 Tax=Massilia forsythiae TaxID=2728020 RepID=A0A7Z2VW96_9BURK|nr:hypothetical protein [Massilia forsythiae]QJE00482.1 hypothetical protein HH212_11005 [Massilia forsythiae]
MSTWGTARHVDYAGFDDVVHVLSRSKGVSFNWVLWLRKRIWWDLNDRYRRRADGSPWPGLPNWPVAAERKNMEVMLHMLQDGEARPGCMIQQGELLRLLGRFDEAIAVLRAVPVDGHSEVRAVKIEKLARGCDSLVRELSRPTW